MTVVVEITRLMTTMSMMWTRRLPYAGVAMSMPVQVTRGVAGVIVMLTDNIARRGVAMTMRVEVAGRVAGMIVVLTAPLLRHCRSPCWYTDFCRRGTASRRGTEPKAFLLMRRLCFNRLRHPVAG